MVDFANGLNVNREETITQAPDKFRYAENFMLAFYDPASGIGMWLHLGTCPDEFGLWEDMVLLSLPDDGGLMWMTAYAKTPVEMRPAGASLSFKCLQPFEQWRISFDGMLVNSSYQEMLTGRVRDGFKQRVSFNFDTHSVAPAWDNNQSANNGGEGAGSMREQTWASEHYQQLFSIKGQLHVGGNAIEINATGVRDHSRGQRGHSNKAWGGHDLWTCAFPSGRAFGMQRMWNPEKQLTLNVGFVYIDGEFHYADVVSEPVYLNKHKLRGDSLGLVLKTALGEHCIAGVTQIVTYINLESPYGLSIGYDPVAGFGTFGPGFSRWEWDGEIGYGLTERSGV